jgi:hypothetical protein
MLCSGSDSTINASTVLLSTFLFFDVETAWAFLNDMSMTLAELLYGCTLSSAWLIGQIEENMQLLLGAQTPIVGAISIWLQRIFIANQPTKSIMKSFNCIIHRHANMVLQKAVNWNRKNDASNQKTACHTEHLCRNLYHVWHVLCLKHRTTDSFESRHRI